ncbi:unnamed protein product, partial [marine sediment metagenome]
LNKHLSSPDFFDKEDIVLIAGSVDKQQNKALISLFCEAFPQPSLFKVWLKPHPFLSFEKLLKELGINLADYGYTIKHNSIDELLKSVKILVVADSAVALEALAAGCKVVSPVFSDSMFTSPLKGFEEYYSRVSNPAELKDTIEEFIERSEVENFSEVKRFILLYWCLDPSLRRWKELLSVNYS